MDTNMEKEKEGFITRVWGAIETIESFIFVGLIVIVSLEWIEWIGRWIYGKKK